MLLIGRSNKLFFFCEKHVFYSNYCNIKNKMVKTGLFNHDGKKSVHAYSTAAPCKMYALVTAMSARRTTACRLYQTRLKGHSYVIWLLYIYIAYILCIAAVVKNVFE